ncbi:hypothetical protein BaRGS_00016295 [Batillaria attramentaria]|uniref:Uncharacterized protein n=1 Tax=Batillaria attramentaria TaxID=370345 RepID=A0ABD0KYX8_9CAEN
MDGSEGRIMEDLRPFLVVPAGARVPGCKPDLCGASTSVSPCVSNTACLVHPTALLQHVPRLSRSRMIATCFCWLHAQGRYLLALLASSYFDRIVASCFSSLHHTRDRYLYFLASSCSLRIAACLSWLHHAHRGSLFVLSGFIMITEVRCLFSLASSCSLRFAVLSGFIMLTEVRCSLWLHHAHRGSLFSLASS